MIPAGAETETIRDILTLMWSSVVSVRELCTCDGRGLRVPVESWDWDRLRELLGVLEAEDRVEPALLAREMGRGTGVTGGESS